VCYNALTSVLACTRFPTPHKGKAGATDRRGNLYNLKTLVPLLLSVLLFVFAAWQKGVGDMASDVAIEFAVHLAIAVGSRVQVRT
jgi:hypothetical protein